MAAAAGSAMVKRPKTDQTFTAVRAAGGRLLKGVQTRRAETRQVVQGGLSTTMELTAARRPFVYIPLEHHFEQQVHVRHRLTRHRAGRALAYADTDPERIAEELAVALAQPVDYLPVPSDGAARAARLALEAL